MSSPKTKPAKPPAARGRRRVAAAEQPAAAEPPAESPQAPANPAACAAGQILDVQKSLLQAGLRALRIEGAAPGKGAWPLTSLEGVFDQRVAAALQRLRIPEQIERLQQQLDALSKKLDR